MKHVLACILAVLAWSCRAEEIRWWRLNPEDRLEILPTGMEWFPAWQDHELHAVFPAQTLPVAKGSRLTISGTVTFRRDEVARNTSDIVRMGLYEVATPTSRNGAREPSVATGVVFLFNPFTPNTKPGSWFGVRKETDAPKKTFLLGIGQWSEKPTSSSGFGCQPDQPYPLVLELERRAPGMFLSRLKIGENTVEHAVDNLEFRPNTLAIASPANGRWKSLRLEDVKIQVTDAGKR